MDLRRLEIRTMFGIKRTVRKHGRVCGHRRGVHGQELLSYGEARLHIYLPTYRFVLKERAADVVEQVVALARVQPVVLLDFEVNGDVGDLSRPLSHAALVAMHARGEWPGQDAR